MYGMLAEESSMDPKMDQLDKLFLTYLQMPGLPEVRERIIRKLYGRMRL